MSRTDRLLRSRHWLARAASGRGLRLAAISVGLGLGSAWAADAVNLSIPEAALTDPTAADDVATSQWRAFDPGFVVDHLPFKLTIGQAISYNDNVAAAFSSVPLLANNGAFSRLPSRGDFYSDTTLSAASRFPMGAETFFFNGTYSPRRYFTDTQLNADNYAINGGVDYNLADRCTGRLIGGVASDQSPQFETAGFGIFTTETTSFNETARCTITGHVFGLLNSGVSHATNTGDSGFGNTLLSFGLNDYDQHYVGTGLEYDLTGLDTLKGVATFTSREFTNRPASLVSSLGLSPNTQQNDYVFYYTRIFTAKLNASVSAGFSTFTTTGSSRDVIEPDYSFSVTYKPTPKIVASFTDSRSTGAPQSVISDVTTNDQQSLSLSYQYSPKTSFAAILSRGENHNPNLGNSLGTSLIPAAFTNYNTNNASLVVNYTATPLVTATASYTYTERTDTSRSGFDAVSNVFRVGLFYTR